MDRQLYEAIERLNIHKSTNVFVDSIAEAIDMAIEALQTDAVQGDECDHCVYKWGMKGGAE